MQISSFGENKIACVIIRATLCSPYNNDHYELDNSFVYNRKALNHGMVFEIWLKLTFNHNYTSKKTTSN